MKQFLKYPFIILCICAFGLFVYPGLYKYDKLEQKYPVKINRITGETQILNHEGSWIKSGNVEAELAKFEEYKQQIYDKISQQKDDIKQEVLTTIYDELSAIKEKQEGIDSRPGDIPTISEEFIEGEGNISTFSEGDTKETVKQIMGTPDQVTKIGNLESWFYGSSVVNFQDGKVNGWHNIGKNLPVK